MTVEILLVHRVLPESAASDDPFGRRSVTPDVLDAALAERSDWLKPSPGALLDAGEERRRLLVTVDDGTVDFEEHALPVIERHGVHCVLSVVSDWAKGVRGPYEAALWRALSDRERVEIPLEGFIALDTDAARHHAFRALTRLYKPLPTAEREGLVAALGVDPCAVDPGTFLGPDRLRVLAEHPLVTIGVHTRTHPFLPRLRGERLAAEVAGGKREVETWIGRRVEWFSYPYGGYDRAARRCVEAAGFRFACAMHPGTFDPRAVDRFALPRTDLAIARAPVRT